MTGAGSRSLVLVNSGAYLEQELQAEFGTLPPSFLPVGLRRLYEWQAELFAAVDCDLYLTLPLSFELSVWDENRLQGLGIGVVRTPDNLSLGAALLHALGHLGFRDRPLRILHGDTLVHGVDVGLDDVIAVAEGEDGYRWGHATLAEDGRITAVAGPSLASGHAMGQRLCGYFAFRSASRFAELLTLAGGSFYEALNSQVREAASRAVAPSRWLDFGHVQTFFRSRRLVTTERAFNSLDIGELRVRKRSPSAAKKLRAEARWLREVPSTVSPFCARLLGEGEDEDSYFYDSEYEYMPTLSELYVFGRVSPAGWSRILASCTDFVEASVAAGHGFRREGFLTGLVIDKTAKRLRTVAAGMDLDLDAPMRLNGKPAPSLAQCLRDIEAVLSGCGEAASVMHGDFCFSNVLYNFRTGRICLIDPRGLTEQGEFSLHGDMRYDLAKLMHSICGRYDQIMAGHYDGRRSGAQAFELSFPVEPWRLEVERSAASLAMAGVKLGSEVVWAAMTSLFLSMPPLHADRPDRQATFIANALRLHQELGTAG